MIPESTIDKANCVGPTDGLVESLRRWPQRRRKGWELLAFGIRIDDQAPTLPYMHAPVDSSFNKSFFGDPMASFRPTIPHSSHNIG